MSKSISAQSFRPQGEGFVDDMLRKGGWWRSDDGWRHPRLNNGKWAWPSGYALKLQAEADDGRQGLIYEMIRGES